jgi:hypothetical protein
VKVRSGHKHIAEVWRLEGCDIRVFLGDEKSAERRHIRLDGRMIVSSRSTHGIYCTSRACVEELPASVCGIVDCVFVASNEVVERRIKGELGSLVRRDGSH